MMYKIPREPTSARVYVWRKLKQLGALLLQDAVWILPANERTQEQLQWLQAEILELKGEATLARASLLAAADDPALVRRFQEQAAEPYREVQAGLKRKKRGLPAL